MSSPTQFYNWTLPAENSDPWYNDFDGMVGAIDTSVRSVEQIAPTRATLVVSLVPSGTWFVTSVDMNAGVGNGWVIMSCAPYGPLVGSFALVTSGGQASVDFLTAAYVEGASFLAQASVIARYRLVVSRTGATSLTIPVNSTAWNFYHLGANQHQQVRFFDCLSLGPGAYRCEMQVNLSGFTASSRYGHDTNDAVFLRMTEATLGR